MRLTSRWQQAVVLSCIINFCLLLVTGWVTASLFVNANPSETSLIEVELLSITGQTSPAALPAAAGAMVNPGQQENLPPPQQAANPASVMQPLIADQANGEASKFQGMSTLLGAAAGTASGAAQGYANSMASGGGEAASSAGVPKPGRILPPRVLAKVEPDYPESARRQGIEGIVRVKIEINEQGRATNAWVTGSSGNDALDEAALSAVRKWRFTPARDENTGAAVACTTSLAIAFDLK